MKSNELALTAYFSSDERKHLYAPAFQRENVWDEDRWDGFFSDLIGVATANGEKTHFIGMLILMNSDPDPAIPMPSFMIIDGQQRLLTTTLFLKACYRFVQSCFTDVCRVNPICSKAC